MSRRSSNSFFRICRQVRCKNGWLLPSYSAYCFALLKDRDARYLVQKGAERKAIALSVAVTATVASTAVLVCTAGEPYLPHIVLDRTRYSSAWPYLVAAPIWGACLPALIVLWIR